MQVAFCFLALLVAVPTSASKADVSPLEMVFQLMDELTAKITKEGEDEEKAYNEFFEWCDDTTKNLGFEIKTYTATKGKLEAKITELTEDAEAASVKIEELASRIAENEKDLADAKKIFEKETAQFEIAEKELVETVDTLSRAIGIIEREMSKNPASFAQIDASSLSGILGALAVISDAAGFNVNDKQKLTALVQAQSDDEDQGAPKPANYASQSGNIVEVLEDMKDKAESELNKLRQDFAKTRQEYKMMKQSLEAQLKADTNDLTDEKTAKAEAQESQATAEKDLGLTTKLLAAAVEGLAKTQSDCMRIAADHDASIKSRAEELDVIAKAKKIVMEATSLTQESQDSEVDSFLQLNANMHMKTRADLVAKEVVMKVKKLADLHHSRALAQLASKVASVLQFGAAAGEDPFAKVKSMLEAMITKLEKEAGEAAAEKAYCDEQMSKTEAKKGDLEDDVEKLKVKIDEATSASAQLKEDVNTLQQELAALAKTQGELDKARSDAHAVYLDTKAELEQALTGIRKALGVLRDYYGNKGASAAMLQEGISDYMKQPKVPVHSKSSGAGGSIIDILEVCESDNAKSLAQVERLEADELSEYERVTTENAQTKATKEQDVKYKTQEYKGLDNDLAEMSEDLKATQSELDAVLDYYEKVKQRCVAKPEPYEERVKRRTAEINGLKEALSILENETAFTQARKRGSHKKQFLAN